MIGLEGHGREEGTVPGSDLTRTVGWFSTGFPMRLDLSGIDLEDACAGGPAIGAAVKSVKEQLLAVPDHGIGYGLLRYLNEETAPILAKLPTPQIGFNYLGRVFAGTPEPIPAVGWMPVHDDSDLAGGELAGTQNPDMPISAVLDISALTREERGRPRLRAIWSYPAGILTGDEVRQIADSWCRVLTALATHTRHPGAGGRTPSDLDLVKLAQPEIERLEHRYPSLSDVWPLTPLQKGLLFHALVSEDSVDAYLVQLVLELHGHLDPDRLRRAGQVLLDRHANLRTAFITDTNTNTGAADAGLVQVVCDDIQAPWSEPDLSGLDEDARNREWDRLMATDRTTRFDPARAPLLRWMLVTMGPQHYRLVLTNHHLLLDGWSTPLLIKELLVLYATDSDTAILPRTRPYRDFLAWTLGQDPAASLDTWARAFDGADEPTLIAPTDPARRYTESREVISELTEEQTTTLTNLARTRGITLNTVIQMAWAIVLGTLTSRKDVTFGTMVSGRPPQIPGIESMIGLFINTLPVRVRLDPTQTLGQLLDRIQTEQAALLDHHHLGLTDIQRVAGPGAMFDTMTVFESYPVDRGGLTADTDIAGMRVVDVTGADAAHYPLGVIAHLDTRLHLKIKYLPELFDHNTIETTLHRVLRVISATTTDPDLPLARLNLLSPAEYQQLTPVSGDRAVPGQVLAEMLTTTAQQNPEAVAVVCGERQWTYGKLDAESNRLARLLISRGMGPETSVAVGLPRSVESVLAVWAVAKSGAAFVPIDPNYPADRITFMMTDSGAQVGITVSTTVAELPGTIDWLVLDAPEIRAELTTTSVAAITPAERKVPLHVAHPAYVIYTSGSTGRPKGAIITHTGLANFAAEQRDRYAVAPSARILHFASPSFDAAMLEQLMATEATATLVIAPTTVYGGEELRRLLIEQRVSHAFMTPSALASVDPTGLDSLRVLVAGGEACPPGLVEQWAPGRAFHNGYGPTETTIMTNISAALAPSTAVTIGGPIRGWAGRARRVVAAGAGWGRGGVVSGGSWSGSWLSQPEGFDSVAVRRRPVRRPGAAHVSDG